MHNDMDESQLLTQRSQDILEKAELLEQSLTPSITTFISSSEIGVNDTELAPISAIHCTKVSVLYGSKSLTKRPPFIFKLIIISVPHFKPKHKRTRLRELPPLHG